MKVSRALWHRLPWHVARRIYTVKIPGVFSSHDAAILPKTEKVLAMPLSDIYHVHTNEPMSSQKVVQMWKTQWKW